MNDQSSTSLLFITVKILCILFLMVALMANEN